MGILHVNNTSVGLLEWADCLTNRHTVDLRLVFNIVIVWGAGGLTILFLHFCLLTGSSSVMHTDLCP